MRRVAAVMASLVLLTGCYQARHFVADPAKMDGLYFGPSNRKTGQSFEDDTWRIYALFGLVAWDDKQVTYAGDRLAGSRTDQRPASFYVETRYSFVNGLAQVGIALIPFVGWLQPFFFVPRFTEVHAWDKGG